MNFFTITILLFFVSGCENFQNIVAPSLKTYEDAIVTKRYVETGGLYTRNYELIIRGNGEVSLNCNFDVEKLAAQKNWKVPPQDIAKLIDAFRQKGFFELNDKYGSIAVDVAEITISASVNGNEKKVTRLSWDNKTQQEKTLRELELLVNKSVNADQRFRECIAYPPEASSYN